MYENAAGLQITLLMASKHNIVIKHTFGLANSISVSVNEGESMKKTRSCKDDNSTGSNSHLRSIDLFKSMII